MGDIVHVASGIRRRQGTTGPLTRSSVSTSKRPGTVGFLSKGNKHTMLDAARIRYATALDPCSAVRYMSPTLDRQLSNSQSQPFCRLQQGETILSCGHVTESVMATYASLPDQFKRTQITVSTAMLILIENHRLRLDLCTTRSGFEIRQHIAVINAHERQQHGSRFRKAPFIRRRCTNRLHLGKCQDR